MCQRKIQEILNNIANCHPSLETLVKNIKKYIGLFLVYMIPILSIIGISILLVCINLKVSPTKYPWIVSIIGLLSTILGSVVGYIVNKHFKRIETQEKAYASAVLIRSWIIEKLSNITDLVKNLEARLDILNMKQFYALDRTSIGYFFEDNEHIIICQDLHIKDDLYGLDLKLIESIAFLKDKFTKFELVLQCLSISANQYNHAIKFVDILKEMKEVMLKTAVDKASKQNILQFLQTIHRHLPSYIDQAKQAQYYLKKMLDGHQKNICDPLAIKALSLDEKEATIKILFDDLMI